jgi:hypothetical protein
LSAVRPEPGQGEPERLYCIRPIPATDSAGHFLLFPGSDSHGCDEIDQGRLHGLGQEIQPAYQHPFWISFFREENLRDRFFGALLMFIGFVTVVTAR